MSSEGDIERRRNLRRMRIVATSLLVLAAIIFVLTLDRDGGWAYVNAAAEAGMVGAIADWFAVTALFRHPLGLPIPHTAIIPRRKKALGESLEEFVTDNFLTEHVVRERLAAMAPSRQVGSWLNEPANARTVVSAGARIGEDALSRLSRTDIAAIMSDLLVPRLLEEPLSATAGEMLQEILRERAHDGVIDLVLDELDRWLNEHGHEVTALVEERAPWWTPQWVDERIADRIYLESRKFVAEVRDDREHRVRKALDSWLLQLSESLQHDPDTMERAERLKERILEGPQVVETAVNIWEAVRRTIIGSLKDADGLLRRRAEQELVRMGRSLQDDDVLAARVDAWLADSVAYVVSNYGDQIATIISTTVDRWDGKETAQRVELHVGKDLQFIRINGTIVGGLAGLLIHTLAHAF